MNERLLKDLRRYAKRYRSGETLGRAIEGTEDIMDEAAAVIEEQQRQLSEWGKYTGFLAAHGLLPVIKEGAEREQKA